VQYAGDYREAFERLSNGGKETYYAQRYSVNLVGSLAKRLEQVAVVCAISEGTYDSVLANGVRAVGSGLKQGFHPSELIPAIEMTRPTRLSLTSPLVPVLKWAHKNQVRTLAPLADSFQGTGLRNAIRRRILAYHLNRPIVDWVGNHGIAACLSLMDIGVLPKKIIPWDWPPSHRPSDYEPRARRSSMPKLFYVGSLSLAKGVGDLLRAMTLLRGREPNLRLVVAGRDENKSIAALARSLEIDDIVDFLGPIANEDVPRKMREADVVVIPSRHEYPEGLPLTIYEALAARTPIVASDHPMFREALVDGKSAVMFPAGDVAKLAEVVSRLLHDDRLYESLSLQSADAWARIQLQVTMGDLLEAWLSDAPAQLQLIRDHGVLSESYRQRIAAYRRFA
jgi:glycosyltransferase involved in cell wall biosynthesis